MILTEYENVPPGSANVGVDVDFTIVNGTTATSAITTLASSVAVMPWGAASFVKVAVTVSVIVLGWLTMATVKEHE